MKKIFNWFKNLWQKEVDKIDDVLDLQFPEPEEINLDNLCPTCHKDFGCQCVA